MTRLTFSLLLLIIYNTYLEISYSSLNENAANNKGNTACSENWFSVIDGEVFHCLRWLLNPINTPLTRLGSSGRLLSISIF